MPIARLAALTISALLCFAANSLLCRAALRPGLVDPATFTTVRLASGALALALLLGATRRARPGGGSLGSALALFLYAAAFSLAYVRIGAGVGALLLFGAVQVTMVGWSAARGTRPGALQALGILVALGGLAALALPGASAPDLSDSERAVARSRLRLEGLPGRGREARPETRRTSSTSLSGDAQFTSSDTTRSASPRPHGTAPPTPLLRHPVRLRGRSIHRRQGPGNHVRPM